MQFGILFDLSGSESWLGRWAMKTSQTFVLSLYFKRDNLLSRIDGNTNDEGETHG